MVSDADLTPERAAQLHAALAHPSRVAALRLLRREVKLTLPALRRRLEEQGTAMDTRSLQHHVGKLHRAGIVDLTRSDGHDMVTLVRDVALRVKLAPPPG